jgi:phage-related protein
VESLALTADTSCRPVSNHGARIETLRTWGIALYKTRGASNCSRVGRLIFLLQQVNIYVNLCRVYEINFYRTRTGGCPVEAFLDSLAGKQAQKVAWTLQLIEELDRVPSKYLEKMTGTDDIWEVRVEFGGNIFRLLGWLDGRALILGHGFQKKTQKTPAKEIETAEQRKHDYFNQKEAS